jgi:CYTH domain-containing protein
MDKKRAVYEIERKFLVRKLPRDFSKYPNKDIVQGYLPVSGAAVRFRRCGDTYFETVKIGRGKKRVEAEVEITKEQFGKLWPATDSHIEKTRYVIPYNGFNIELDYYHGRMEGMLVAEVEFSSVRECDSFIPPEWFGKEVTEDGRFSNLALARTPKSALPRDFLRSSVKFARK